MAEFYHSKLLLEYLKSQDSLAPFADRRFGAYIFGDEREMERECRVEWIWGIFILPYSVHEMRNTLCIYVHYISTLLDCAKTIVKAIPIQKPVV